MRSNNGDQNIMIIMLLVMMPPLIVMLVVKVVKYVQNYDVKMLPLQKIVLDFWYDISHSFR